MSRTSVQTGGGQTRYAAILAAALLAAIGAGAIVRGIEGRSTVRSALAQEHVVGTPDMSPSVIAHEAQLAGLHSVALPGCSVAGKPIADGSSAHCFAEYMRIHVLMLTHGVTYSQMPGFASADGEGTSNIALAKRHSDGQPVQNPAVRVWVTETAMSMALNTSYMAEQIALFGIAVGTALLLVAVALAALALGRSPVRGTAFEHATAARPATALTAA